MTKSNRIITGILGVSMFMFGILKFLNPFKTWYWAQVIQSELPFPTLSFWSGQVGEIIIGMLLLYILIFNSKNSSIYTSRIFIFGNVSVILMMIVAFYVHLHPDVAADVLPLKIKAPYIPGFFLILAILNLYFQPKNEK